MARRPQLTPEGRQPVENYDASTLHRLLVEDAVKRHATFLPWAVAAYDRIGRGTRRGAEDAFTAVLDEVEALTGMRMMPVAKPTTTNEVAQMQQPT